MDLSIIIPVYNAEKLIERCLDSIFSQQQYNFTFEVITINDGSKDGSLEVLKKVKVRYTELNIIDQQNAGAGTARNTGINSALGKYIWFIDIDDFIEPGAFNILQRICIDGAEEKTVGFNYNKVSSGGKKTKANSNIEYKEVEKLEGVDYLISNKPYYLWVIIFQRSLIEQSKLRFIDGIKNIEDLEFSIRYFNICPKVEYHNIWLYNYFENESSTSRNRSRENLLKLADDTIVVHKSIGNVLQQIKNGHNAEVIRKILEISIAGFFFSLVQYGYTISEVKKFYEDYRKNGLLPIPVIKANKKFIIFSNLLNRRALFYLFLYFKKKFRS